MTGHGPLPALSTRQAPSGCLVIFRAMPVTAQEGVLSRVRRRAVRSLGHQGLRCPQSSPLRANELVVSLLAANTAFGRDTGGVLEPGR